jgi:hypothetical protein
LKGAGFPLPACARTGFAGMTKKMQCADRQRAGPLFVTPAEAGVQLFF